MTARVANAPPKQCGEAVDHFVALVELFRDLDALVQQGEQGDVNLLYVLLDLGVELGTGAEDVEKDLCLVLQQLRIVWVYSICVQQCTTYQLLLGWGWGWGLRALELFELLGNGFGIGVDQLVVHCFLVIYGIVVRRDLRLRVCVCGPQNPSVVKPQQTPLVVRGLHLNRWHDILWVATVVLFAVDAAATAAWRAHVLMLPRCALVAPCAWTCSPRMLEDINRVIQISLFVIAFSQLCSKHSTQCAASQLHNPHDGCIMTHGAAHRLRVTLHRRGV